MIRGATIFFLICSPFSQVAAQGAANDREVIVLEYPSTGAVQVGLGIDERSLIPKPSYCLVTNYARQAINSNRVTFRKVVDTNSYANTLEISAEAKMQAVTGSIEGSADYVRSVKIDSSSTNIAAYGVVVTEELSVTPLVDPELDRDGASSSIEQIALNEVALGLVNGPSGYLKFKQQCGDYFVSSIKYGGSFGALLSMANTTRDESESIEASLKGSCPSSDNLRQMRLSLC